MSRRTVLSAAVSAAVFSPVLPSFATGKAHSETWIPSKKLLAELPRIMEVGSLPGLAIATVEGGEVIWSHSMGVTNVTTQEPITGDTVFEAASMGKSVFAYVVMRLVDEKLIDLDRPLVQYRRPDYLSNDPNIDLITARDVLRHSSGLPNWRTDPKTSLTPLFKPGTRWRYSGEGYFWLQLIVEKVTGMGIDTVMRARLFDPAKMPQSTYAWDTERERHQVYGHNAPGDLDDGPVVGYDFFRVLAKRMLPVAEKWGKPISAWTYEDVTKALPDVPDFKMPTNVLPNVAMSLGTTVTEYAKFMTLMLNRPKREDWEISESSREAMLSPQIMRKANAIYWGLGWELEPSASSPLFYHGGNNGGIFKNFGVGDAANGRAIVIFTNGSTGDRFTQRIIEDATGYCPLEFMLY